MATWPDPRALSLGIAFGNTAFEDPTGLTYTQVAPNPDDETDPGDLLGEFEIDRGRVGDSAETGTTRIRFALRNEGGKYSPRNVSGEHYGQLRMGTPMEIALDTGSGPQTLARAAIPSWSPNRIGPSLDERIQLDALGILARIARDSTALPPIRRVVTASNPVAYWPREDGVDATSAGSATSGVAPMSVQGAVEFGADETLPGSLGAPDLTAGTLLGTVPPGGSAAAWHVEFWMLASFSAGTRMAFITTAGAGFARLDIRQPASASGSIDVLVFDSAGGSVGTASGVVSGWDETDWHHIAVSATQNGANVDVSIYADGTLLSVNIFATQTLTRVTGVTINDRVGLTGLTSCAHVAVGDGVTPSDSAEAGNAYIGETASERVDRIFAEEGIAGFASASDSATMGAQPAATTYQILRECEDADGGVLFEIRNGFLVYVPNSERYNQTVTATYAFGTDGEPGDITDLIPFDDDRDLYNIAEVAQPDGTFAVAEKTDGPVGSDETTGVGPRRMPRQVRNLYLAGDVKHHAGWLLRKGTVNRPRYVVVLDLLANQDLASAIPLMGVGHRIQITGVDSDHEGPDTLDLIVEGERIRGGSDVLRVTWYCEPFEPWRVQQLADTPPADNTLDGWLTPTSFTVDTTDFEAGTDTSMDVAVTPAITTDAGVMPLRIKALGWVGEVTAVGAASGGVQTLTITQTPVNGVEKTIPAGTALELVDPLILAL